MSCRTPKKSRHPTRRELCYVAGSISKRPFFARPEAKYFGIGKINRDQVLDYQVRKGMPLEELERRLRPNLNYLPEKLPVGG